jgi:hypothetical protein
LLNTAEVPHRSEPEGRNSALAVGVCPKTKKPRRDDTRNLNEVCRAYAADEQLFNHIVEGFHITKLPTGECSND